MTARRRVTGAELAGTAIHWIVACGAGPLIGSWLFSSVLLRLLPAALFPPPVFVVVLQSVAIGALTGAAQTRVLSPSIAGTWRWVGATMAGYTAASMAAVGAVRLLGHLPAIHALRRGAEALGLLLAGTLMGAIQSHGWPPGGRRRSLEWGLAVGAGWLLGALLPGLLPGMASFAYAPNGISRALWGVGIGLATLAPLARRIP